MIVYSSFICNSQKLEIIIMFFNGSILKLWYIHAMEYHVAIKEQI